MEEKDFVCQHCGSSKVALRKEIVKGMQSKILMNRLDCDDCGEESYL